MNPRDAKFCFEYVKNGGKPKQAGIAAGFPIKGAGTQASRLLKKVEIKNEISRLLNKVAPECLVDHKYVIERLKKIVDHCMLLDVKPVNKDELDGDIDAAPRYDASGANKALELIGRHLKMFTDKLEVKDTTNRAAAIAAARKRIIERGRDNADPAAG